MRGRGIALIGSLLLCGSASAACSVVATAPVSFGSVSSMTVNTTAQGSSTANAGLRCTPTLIALVPGSDHFIATITSATSGMVGPTGDVIGYTIYGNNSASFPINRGVAFDFGTNGIASSFGLVAGPGAKTLPLYVGSITGSNVAAGVYTETLNIVWSWDYCSLLSLGNVCLARDKSSNPPVATLTVSMTVTNDCQITAPNISFGSAPVISGFTAVTGQTINIACTKGSAYSVGLSDGQNAVSVGGRRRMISGSNYLAYDIFKSAGTTRWGSVGAARRASSTAEINPGNGLGIGSQVFNYNARIYTDQPTPPAGTYLDNVVLDVGF